jgi:ribonuclease P protein component
MTDERLPRIYCMRRPVEYDRAFRRRATASDSQLVVFGCENRLGFTRLGISVSRKVGKAVIRNRWKRLIREAFRLTRRTLPVGVDLVVIPRRGAEPRLIELKTSLPQLARRVAARLAREGR